MDVKLSFSNMPGYARLMRLDKPVGIYLLLWPTLWALVVASKGLPSLFITAVFVAGVVIMRSAGCIINDYADRHVDGDVKRTSARPLVSGEVSEKEALQLFALLIGVSFGLVLLLNWQTVAMSVAALILAASYPFMKRYTHLPQVVLGAAFGWAIPMAFTAITETVPVWGWLLFMANLCWTVAYDTMYAMVDRDDDVRIGVKSTAVLFGRFDKAIIVLLQLITLLLLLSVGVLIEATWPYYLSLVVTAVLFTHAYTRIRHREREACFKAFIESHYVGMVVTAGLLANYLL
ncbi:4-hydroxybenzoate octaprenyltransferase [Alteromonas antoniana]|uniref:4-hydroxybenzoate octaprenyltransferase n=1 Tax=Alteromonas antoniana TaxID=2803813 RepID=UPI001C466E1F|nr:4-hydroxybenzoate octaprenyltransferase [Alteromonas antoniana]